MSCKLSRNEHWLSAALCAVLAAGCESEPPPLPDESGQTGSPGEHECFEDSECRASAQAQVAALTAPTTSARRFASSACEQVQLLEGQTSHSGPTCVCATGDGGSVNIGPAGVDCYVRGRAGNCLWQGAEYSDCDLDDPNSCAELCAELEQRYADDAARSFQASVVYASCAESGCRNVLEIEGLCYPSSAVGSGAGYDCGLGGEAILRAYDEDRTPPPPERVSWEAPSAYVDGTRGFVELGVSRDAYGAFALETGLYASAQFADVRGSSARHGGEVTDPLDGIDDCGAFAVEPTFQPAELGFFHVSAASIESEGETFAVAPTPANNQWFSSYAADLSAQPPRYGGVYRFAAHGGGLREPLSVPVQLPEALSISSLADTEHLAKGPLALRWTGRGEAPLQLLMWVEPKLRDTQFPYRIECLLRDDGAHVIPEQVLTGAPDGFVTAIFTREVRKVESSGDQRFLSLGKLTTTHRYALGERCERPEVLAACERFADHQAAAYAACGIEPPPRESTCPAYLASACGGCVEYFACRERGLRCQDGGLVSSIACSCP